MIGMCKCNSVNNISQFEKCSLTLMYTHRHNNSGPEYSSICNGNNEYVSSIKLPGLHVPDKRLAYLDRVYKYM